MDFKKKLKKRLYYNIGWMVLGVTMVIVWFVTGTENTFLFSFGIAMFTIGVIRIIQYKITTKDEKSLRQQELEETDERNRMIAERAKSWTFSFSLMAAGVVVIVLSLLGKHDVAQPFAWYVCVMVFLYWLFYYFLKRKY